MHRTILLIGSLFFFLASPVLSQHSTTTHVLFIGNSYTYFNNLPEVFALLAEGGHHGKVETAMVAPGGWRLKDHWEKGTARELLESKKWDFVVLQEQSTLGMNYWIDGKSHVNSDAVFRPFAEKWSAAAHARGAVPVFFLTWAAKNAPEDQPALTYAYTRAAKDTGSVLAPVGMAWEALRRENPESGLFYEGHGSHPSPAGTYLAACVLYATLFHQSPIGLPSKLVGTPVNLDTAKPEEGKSVTLVELNADDADRLQKAAWSTWQRITASGGYPVISPPQLPPSNQPLPKGLPLSAQDLDGTWEGTTLFYPAPVNLILHVQNAQGPDTQVLKAHLDIQFHSKDFPDESVEVPDFHIQGSSFFFTEPNTNFLSGLRVQWTGVMVKPGELQGTADARTETAEVHGTWSLKKVSSPTR
jgi:hypothetical protein